MKANKKRITLDLVNLEKTALVGKALSSEVRLEILKLFHPEELAVVEQTLNKG